MICNIVSCTLQFSEFKVSSSQNEERKHTCLGHLKTIGDQLFHVSQDTMNYKVGVKIMSCIAQAG